MKKKELIIFDMDGTLINSGNVISDTINHVRVNIGLEIMPKEILLSNINNPDINPSDFFYGTNTFTDEQIELFEKYYDKHCISDIVLYDGILEMLNNISSKYILTVATNASVEFANKMLNHLNIDNYFNFVIGANSVAKAKPHPDMLLKTLSNCGILDHKSILVGDSLKDERAAKAANMDSILVNWGFTKHYGENIVNNAEELTTKLLIF